MKNILLLLTLIGILTPGIAQFKNPSEEKSKAFIERKILYVEDGFTDEQKEWFKKYWKFDHDIQFVSKDALEGYVKEEKKDASMLTAGTRNEELEEGNMRQTKEVYMVAAYLCDDAKKWDNKNVDTKQKREIFKVSFMNEIGAEFEFKFLGEHFYNYMSKADGKNSSAIADKVRSDDDDILPLATKTLLIPEEGLKLSEADIKAIYPYPFKIVKGEYINNAIMQSKPDEVYLNLLFSDVGFQPGVFAIACADSKILNSVGVGGVKFGFSVRTPGMKHIYAFGKDFELKEVYFKTFANRIKKAEKKAAK